MYIWLYQQVEPLGGARRNMVFKDEEVFIKAYRAGVRALIPKLSLAQRLAVFASSELMVGLTPEELMAGLPPEELKAGLTLEELMAGLTPELLRAGLTAGRGIAGLTPEQLEELKLLLH